MKKLLFAILTFCLFLIGSGATLAVHAEQTTLATHNKPVNTSTVYASASYYGVLNDAVRPQGCQALQDRLAGQQSYAHAIRADLYDPAMLTPSEEAAIVGTMGTLQSQVSQAQAELTDCLDSSTPIAHPQGCQALQDQLTGLRYGVQVIKADLSDSILNPSEVTALSGTLVSLQSQIGQVQAELNGC